MKKLNKRNAGFTLVEILVVLVIATIVLSIAIPRIRTINRERGIREAARVVGSTLSDAGQRAATDGIAGFLIRPNRNYSDGGRWIIASEIGILRAVPNYVGDQSFVQGETPIRGASRVDANTISIPVPLEHSENPPVRAGDWISINNSPVQYEISSTNRAGIRLQLDLDVNATGGYPSLPPAFTDVPFVVHRQPKLLRSSIEFLPDQYAIDLRFSGFTTGTSPVFPSPVTANGVSYDNYEIEILFDDSGVVDRVFFQGLDASGNRTGDFTTRTPSSQMYFLITETPETAEENPTADELALWITVNTQTANPTIGYNTPQPEETMADVNNTGLATVLNRARRDANESASP
jgi:prepilin-type N-terminal cleavage/methylation domain-containing protein